MFLNIKAGLVDEVKNNVVSIFIHKDRELEQDRSLIEFSKTLINEFIGNGLYKGALDYLGGVMEYSELRETFPEMSAQIIADYFYDIPLSDFFEDRISIEEIYLVIAELNRLMDFAKEPLEMMFCQYGILSVIRIRADILDLGYVNNTAFNEQELIFKKMRKLVFNELNIEKREFWFEFLEGFGDKEERMQFVRHQKPRHLLFEFLYK